MHRVWNPFRDRWQQLLRSCSNEANLTADSPSPELVKQGKSASGLSEGKTETRISAIMQTCVTCLCPPLLVWFLVLLNFFSFLAHSMQQSALPLWLLSIRGTPSSLPQCPFYGWLWVSPGCGAYLIWMAEWLALADESVLATVTRAEDWKPLADWGLPPCCSWETCKPPVRMSLG